MQMFFVIFQVVEIAKEMTGTNDSDLAVKLFRERLNSTESFFNDAPIPANESNKEAHKRCSDLTGAEKYCPKRWAAMQLWFKEARRVGKFWKCLCEEGTWMTQPLSASLYLGSVDTNHS